MKRQITQNSNFGILSTAVVTATLLGCTAMPQGASASQTPEITTSGVYVNILSPTVDVADPTKQIEISAFYQAAPITGGVTTLELYVDGQQIAVKRLDSPEDRGIVSFVISPGTLAAGAHHIVVRVSATDAEVASAKTGLNIAEPAGTDSAIDVPTVGGTDASGSAPAVAIMTPTSNATVTGTVDIKVDAHDNSGKAPYVSLFIDHTFKTLRNFPPFDFAWDTTRVANGYHTIEVWGYNDDQAVGHAQPMTVFVNNPGGRTLVRHDLLDTVAPSKVLVDSSRTVSHTAAVHLHPAVKSAIEATAKTSVSLAQGSLATAHQMDKLASANVDGSQSMLSDQDQLMAPFIPAHAPALEQVTTESGAQFNPTLAYRSVTNTTGSADELSRVAPQSPTLSGAIELMTPTVETLTSTSIPSVSVAEVKTAPVAVAPVKVQEVQIAAAPLPPVMVTSGVPTSDTELTTSVKLDPSTSPVISDDQEGASLESPTVALKPIQIRSFAQQVHASAVLARVINANAIPLESNKMASATISSSDLLAGGPMLQAPELPARRVLNLIATHEVQTKLVPLGQSAAGFPAANVERWQVVMNDRPLLLSQPMQDHEKFLFAPFRQIFENEGGIMSWNPSLRSVHALNGSRDIEITIGSKTATVNQEPISMNAAPYIVKGHTMIPLAFIPIALDATVNYDPASGHIEIDSKE